MSDHEAPASVNDASYDIRSSDADLDRATTMIRLRDDVPAVERPLERPATEERPGWRVAA